MSQERDAFTGEEISLREVLLVPLRKWWVVVSVFAAVVTVAAVMSFRQPDVYEARTKLLIVAPVSERILGPVPGTDLSVETLSALATANDLVEKIIVDLELRDSITGHPWRVEQLAGMLSPKVETAGPGAGSALPLLTMIVRGGNPGLLKRIANKWSDVFILKHSQLFTAEGIRSYDFVINQYEENQMALRATQESRLAYQQGNPLPGLQGQLEVTTARYKEFLSQLQTKRAGLADAEARLAYYQEALTALRQERADKVAFQKANVRDLLVTELTAITALYHEFLSDLEMKQAALAGDEALVQSLQTALLEEPRVQILKRSIPNDSLFEFLDTGISPERLEALGDLVVEDEEPNPTYFALKESLHSAQTAVATRSAEVQDLGSRTVELEGRIEQLLGGIGDIDLKLTEFSDDIAVLNPGGSLTGQLATARADVSLLGTVIGDLEQRTEQLDSETQGLSERIAQIQLDLSRFDQEISVLKNNLDRLDQSVLEAQLAKAEQAGSIRVVESAVEPGFPVGPNRRQNLLLAAVLGPFLGVGLAMLVHYLWVPQGPRQGGHPPQPAARVSPAPGRRGRP